MKRTVSLVLVADVAFSLGHFLRAQIPLAGAAGGGAAVALGQHEEIGLRRRNPRVIGNPAWGRKEAGVMKDNNVLSRIGFLLGAVGVFVLMGLRQLGSLGCSARAFAVLGTTLGVFVVPAPAATVADSFDDWSTTGTQGANGWYGGYYDETADIETGYAASDFTQFTSEQWSDGVPGGTWCLNVPGNPWTRLEQGGTHPNGENSGNVHWTIRRWQADRDYLFLGGSAPTCLDAADAEDNGAIQMTDAIYTLNYLFLGGPALPTPFGTCGMDGTADELDCASYSPCAAGE